MSYEKFKKTNFSSSEVKNPYVDPLKKETGEEGKVGKIDHYTAEVTSLKRENKELKEDVASLYLMIMNIDTSDLTLADIKSLYLEFKKDPRHLIHRRGKKE